MEGKDEGSSLSASPISVDLSRDSAAVVDLTGKVHQLPCCIKYDGPTSVSHYFKPKPAGKVYECTTDICTDQNTWMLQSHECTTDEVHWAEQWMLQSYECTIDAVHWAERMNAYALGACTLLWLCCFRLWSSEWIQSFNCIGMEVDGLKVEEAYFRGRKLHGTTIAVPEGYSGNSHSLLIFDFCQFYWVQILQTNVWNMMWTECVYWEMT